MIPQGQERIDFSQIQPSQSGPAHPIGKKFPAVVTMTKVVPTKENDGGMFRITFTTPAGTIDNNYNLWNKSETAVRISKGQLSALCHATGVFQMDFAQGVEGAMLRGKQCMIDVEAQLGKDGLPNGYVQVGKVYDIQGNEPGGPVGQVQQQPQQQQPTIQQGNQSWNAPDPAVEAAPPKAAQSWGAAQQAASAPAQQSGGWQQNASPSNGAAPWGK